MDSMLSRYRTQAAITGPLSLPKGLEHKVGYRSLAWYKCNHIFLLEALAPVRVALGSGPLAATFSGNVLGMSRNLRVSNVLC